MEVNKIYKGMALDVIKTFPDKSINSVITSPAYWQLRDYGWDGQWGAIDLQRKFIGIEGSEEYVKIGNKKLHKYLVSQQLF